ncbi:hypothetical protein MASR2M78_02080 [Treponema sp.]
MSASDGKLRGFLKVYASVTACYSVLPPFAAALSRVHPELHLSVETGDPADAEQMLRDGRAELVVAALSSGSFLGLDSFSVQRTPLVFATSSSGAYGKLGGSKKNLQDQPFILPKTGLARERFDSWARDKNFKPIVAAEAAGNEAILALARLGLGIGLVPRLVLENGPFAEGLTVYEADKAIGDYEIGYVLRSAWTGAEAGKRLRDAIRFLLKETYPSGLWREATA